MLLLSYFFIGSIVFLCIGNPDILGVTRNFVKGSLKFFSLNIKFQKKVLEIFLNFLRVLFTLNISKKSAIFLYQFLNNIF